MACSMALPLVIMPQLGDSDLLVVPFMVIFCVGMVCAVLGIGVFVCSPKSILGLGLAGIFVSTLLLDWLLSRMVGFG